MVTWYVPALATVTPVKVRVPPLPMKPTFCPPEHAPQLATLAPPPRVLAPDSASYETGPGPPAVASTVKVSKTAWAGVPAVCEVMNMPASWVSACPGTVAVPTRLQALPSVEYQPVYVEPVRTSLSQTGTLSAMVPLGGVTALICVPALLSHSSWIPPDGDS